MKGKGLLYTSGLDISSCFQWERLLEAGKWFRLIFSELAKAFDLVCQIEKELITMKTAEAAEAGQRTSGLLNKI